MRARFASSRAIATALAVAVLLTLAGCGESNDGGPAVVAGESPEPSGALRVAFADPLETMDPLYATTRAERLASRQVHEPLISTQSGPFGQARKRPGLVRSFRPGAGDTIWTATLRGGVRFQNGEPFDSDAVEVNIDRWQSSPAGEDLLPELIVASSPQPGQVRFQLDRPSPRFPQRLADARLGLVAPTVIASAGTQPFALSALRTGTGPFELREREGDRTLLARNANWWGTPFGLGPGVDQLELIYLRDGRLRVDGLVGDAFEVADELTPELVRTVQSNPLLTVARGGGAALGMERSVRGIETAAADQSLANVWLTDIR